MNTFDFIPHTRQCASARLRGHAQRFPNSVTINKGQQTLTFMQKHWFKLILLTVVLVTVSAPWATSEDQAPAAVPAFNAAAPAKGEKLPPILGKEDLWGDSAKDAYQTHAYELAAKIPAVLHQQPCYCYCDRGMGHNSLHSCFEGTHGAHCTTCLKELYYTYQQNKSGKTAAQIRKGIIAGEWKQVDLQTDASIN
jgi:hypothetical protein